MKICLNMIVKDEEKIIERCLLSAIPFIDFFVIMDTGSKDKTMDVIKKTFDQTNRRRKKDEKIKGILFSGDFKNFSHARNTSLSVAYDKSNCDFILFLDADHTLIFPKYDPLSVKRCLKRSVNSYYFSQDDGKLEYKNTRLIRNNRGYYYKGYTHEVLLCLSPKEIDVRKTLGKDLIFINDLSDGGSKDDKSDRDVRLLIQEIHEIESDVSKETSDSISSRPYFYLANTYFGRKNMTEAEKYYKLRISFGGWKEELWYCYYRLGMIKIFDKKIPEAMYFFQSAIETNWERLEAYFHLLLIFRDLRMDINFQIYLDKAKHIIECDFPTQDFLFHEKEVVDRIKKMSM